MDLNSFIQVLQCKCENLLYEYDEWKQLWYESQDAESDFKALFVDVVYKYAPRGKDLKESDYEKISNLGLQLSQTLEFHSESLDYDQLVLKLNDIVRLLISDVDVLFLLGY